MSEHGTPPPPDPNQPYGQPGQPGQPYGQPSQPYGAHPGHVQTAPAAYAGWGQRVGAFLIDALLTSLAALPLWIGYALVFASAETTTVNGTTTIENNSISGGALLLILLGFVTYFAFFIWNTILKQGKTGYSIGKGLVGIKLIGMQTGQPIGGGMTFVRQLAHIIDGLPCYIGYLWPLWDQQKQTFADKILSTVVIQQPKP